MRSSGRMEGALPTLGASTAPNIGEIYSPLPG